MIIEYMYAGDSYSRAYQKRKGAFDTKNWQKVANRAAACRAHVLTATASLEHLIVPDGWAIMQGEAIRYVGLDIQANATTLIGEINRFTSSSSTNLQPTKLSKDPSDDASLVKVMQNLRTAESKLKKNCDDVPVAEAKLGEPPNGEIIAKTIAEAETILITVSRLLATQNPLSC